MSDRTLDRLFARVVHGTPWRGSYSSFGEAKAHPSVRDSPGYNHDTAAKIYTSRELHLKRPSDYATLFHLSRLLRPGVRIGDIGGSVGMAYYVAAHHLPLPEELSWTIYDVPRILDVGRERALANKVTQLHFSESAGDLSGSDIVITSGALQYIEESLPTTIAQWEKKPLHILINRVPVWDRPTLYCIQKIVDFSCVYQVFNRDEFIRQYLDAGYKLIDEWPCSESTFSLRFHPGIRLNAYSGFYLVHDGSSGHENQIEIANRAANGFNGRSTEGV